MPRDDAETDAEIDVASDVTSGFPLNWYQHRPQHAVFDEALDEHGQVRAPWASLARKLAGLGEHGLAERARRCDHLLATYGAAHFTEHGWRLDPIPLVIGRGEWGRLVAGITERARVLAAIAADFAGPRTLLRDGIVPASAVFSDPAFLPLAPTGWVKPLLWYGADLVRDKDGHWRVLRDRTDVPRGIGEALLHRSVVARVLGDLSDRPGPAPLTDHLDEFRGMLGRAAPRGNPSPRTVVLTREAGSVEHLAASHLSAQLGFHRTSAPDLVVRERKVWLRSLGGLEPVDVVVRTLPAAELDPLAGTARGHGVPGIVHAERAGAVAIVNPVSAALAGSRGVAPHLDAAARHLLGTTPALTSSPSAWCGDRDVVAAVLADPSRWVLYDVFRSEATFGSELDRGGPRADDWRQRLRLSPSAIVAHERLDLATVPVVRDGRAVPGTVVLGVSAVIDGDDVHVLPGGFARVVEPDEPIAGQHSGWAKDVWVFEGRAARPHVRLAPLPQVDLRQSVPTRAAEAMYWLGRFAEAAEVQARLVSVVGERAATGARLATVGEGDGDGDGSWTRAAAAMLRAAGSSLDDSASLDDHLTASVRGPSGVVERLDRVLAAAGTVREFLSTSMGRVLADLHELRAVVHASDSESLEQLLVSLAALAGLAQESTVRGPAWRMLDLGRRVERALAVLGAVEAALGQVPARDGFQAVGETLLAAHESLNAYRRWHRTDIELDALVDLLVLDDSNPRSVAFQLDRVVEHLASLPTGRDERALASAASVAALETSAGIVPLVLGVRGPLLSLADSFVRRWFADPIGPHVLGSPPDPMEPHVLGSPPDPMEPHVLGSPEPGGAA